MAEKIRKAQSAVLATNGRATAIRAAVRAVVVFVTAFGLKLSGDQVAAIYGVTEAGLQVAGAFYRKGL